MSDLSDLALEFRVHALQPEKVAQLCSKLCTLLDEKLDPTRVVEKVHTHFESQREQAKASRTFPVMQDPVAVAAHQAGIEEERLRIVTALRAQASIVSPAVERTLLTMAYFFERGGHVDPGGSPP